MLPLAVFLLVGVFTHQTFADEPEAIVGGTPAAPGEFPHQASLRYNGGHICGGSIIAPTKILTAAHCVYGKSASYFKVATGTISITGGQLHFVQRILIHPGYTGRQEHAWVNDIAVMTLATPIQYDQYTQPITLANAPPATGTWTTLSGWGMTSADGPAAHTLLKMNQAIVSQSECQKRHYGMPLTDSHLCAYNQRGIGACMGDSGGPLIANGVQVGVVSWSSPCAVGVPDVYTNVANQRSFIASS